MNFQAPVAEQMTWRARAYLAITAAQHSLIGIIAFAAAHEYDGSPWAVLLSVLSLKVWGATFVLGACHFGYAAISARENHARVALIVSATLTAIWAAGFTLSAIGGNATALLIGVILGVLAGKDLVVCAQPLRSPLEREQPPPGR